MTKNPQMVIVLAVASIFAAFGRDRWALVWAALTKDKSTSSSSTGSTTPTSSVWDRLDPDNDGWVTVYRIGDDGMPDNKTGGAERFIEKSKLPDDYYTGKELCKTGNILVVAAEDVKDESDAFKLRQFCVVREDVLNAEQKAKKEDDKPASDDTPGKGAGYAYNPGFSRVPVFGHYERYYPVAKVREHEGMMR